MKRSEITEMGDSQWARNEKSISALIVVDDLHPKCQYRFLPSFPTKELM